LDYVQICEYDTFGSDVYVGLTFGLLGAINSGFSHWCAWL